jgi:hypothetical protein
MKLVVILEMTTIHIPIITIGLEIMPSITFLIIFFRGVRVYGLHHISLYDLLHILNIFFYAPESFNISENFVLSHEKLRANIFIGFSARHIRQKHHI